jgi:hypothetical protein
MRLKATHQSRSRTASGILAISMALPEAHTGRHRRYERGVNILAPLSGQGGAAPFPLLPDKGRAGVPSPSKPVPADPDERTHRE